MRRPTVFISSTVYDFRDLRSSIKDYLELRGCRVLASDHNDFSKDLDPHSYEACIRAIEQADVFLLLIGSRVGGFFDAVERISITRAEYRRAYDLAQQGRIRILSFVRAEVSNHRESVRDLEKYLRESAVLEHETGLRLSKAPTKFMSDAETITSFIEEVGRNVETTAASRGERKFPKANWLHQFTTFAEIRQQLDILILAGFEVSEAAGRAALLTLLNRLLKEMLTSVKGRALLPGKSVRELVKEIGLRADGILGTTALPPQTWSRFVHLILMSPRPADPAALVPILSSPLLLEYEPATSAFRETDEHRALGLLVRQIGLFNSARSLADFVRLAQGVKVQGGRPIRVPTDQVANHLQLLCRWCDMAATTAALAKAMQGKILKLPEPMPRTPYLDQEAGLAAEEISLEMVRAFLEA